MGEALHSAIASASGPLRATAETDFAPAYAALETLHDIAPDAVLAEDRVFTRGTQAYAGGSGG